MFYLTKIPSFFSWFTPSLVWRKNTTEKVLYLTFDDGPHPIHTPFVLQQLKAFNAKATFFCIGNNVAQYPAMYKQIIMDGHAVGNHTYNHVNGRKTAKEAYVDDIKKAASIIDSKLFRPPYGSITAAQVKALKKLDKAYEIVMYNVLSADFDQAVTEEKCLENVINNANNGSIVVFHDSDKAAKNLYYALPKVLAHFASKGYSFNAL
jgi:peptidoglycan-N-acetylglucosamine deacetylase